MLFGRHLTSQCDLYKKSWKNQVNREEIGTILFLDITIVHGNQWVQARRNFIFTFESTRGTFCYLSCLHVQLFPWGYPSDLGRDWLWHSELDRNREDSIGRVGRSHFRHYQFNNTFPNEPTFHINIATCQSSWPDVENINSAPAWTRWLPWTAVMSSRWSNLLSVHSIFQTLT